MKTLFRWMSAWPLPLLHAFGAVLGWLAFLASPTYRRRFLANAAQAGFRFAEVRPAVAAAGRLVVEAPRLWFGELPPVEWDDPALVERARAAGRGLLFLTPHQGGFESTALGYAQRFGPITVLYRPPRKAWLRGLVESARTRPNVTAVPTNLAGVRQLLRTLRAGGTVGLLPDQVPPQGMGAWAPFFGRDAYTMTLAARLARQTGAAVLLARSERLPGGAGFRVHVTPWPGEPPAEAPEAAAAQVNACIEDMVRACPGQYLWGYARYKEPRQEGPA
ncbi:lysophospholipid acyltransferase family protein [Ramlibacter sp.]|uniref:lysophospholipid acyltransferase family protein n=1 Tax=Ramlibacter sp. TaxID=1917967 RepID=UPI0035B3CF2B